MIRPNNVMIEDRVELENIPLGALSPRTIAILGLKLDTKKILPSEDGYQRDFRGIATLSGLSWSEYGPMISRLPHPTEKVLELWIKDKKNASLGQLQQVLGLIDRWDVVDDTEIFFIEDAHKFLSDQARGVDKVVELDKSPELEVLTRGDFNRIQAGLPPQNYDAFVLFADEDIDFTTELIDKMEGSGYKLCVKERDLVAGVTFEHEAILRLISERCNRLIVIISPAFLRSTANAFFVNYAQAIGIHQGRRKIIPCIIEKCAELPQSIRFLHSLNYMRSAAFWNFWDKLHDSLKTTPTENLTIADKARITELTESFEAMNTKEKIPLKVSLPAINESNKENTYRLSNTPSTPSKSKTLSLFKKSKPDPADGMINKSAPLRSQSSSMMNLSTLDNGVSNYSILSKSSTNINSTVMTASQILSEPSKKNKWYSKFIPTPKETIDTVKPAKKDKEDKKKKKWFSKKKKVAVLEG